MIMGFIIAGGSGKRMTSGHKPSTALTELPLISHVAARLQKQIKPVIIINNDPGYLPETLDLPVARDFQPGRGGPLVGIITAMLYARANQTECNHLVSVPCDGPFFPETLVERLTGASGPDTPSIAVSNGRRHPLFACWPVSLLPHLQDWVAAGNARAGQFLKDCGAIEVDFPLHEDGTDPFFNINTPEDLAEAERILAARRSAGMKYP
ncbi:molybdenum cofactor guanylyltransferase MobA [Pannonibacter sp. Pt2-lr]|uniref:Molybdenum cofactor guanylyltransferase n=1 Tax=Pannonibacter anstelovis TaxID=3121537 RepID=A0ABU7ZKM8_9HYPH